MRNERTPWNRSYNDPQIDTLAKELRSKRKREINRSGAQKLQSEHWDRFFQINGTQPRRKLHADDLAVAKARRRAEEAVEDRALQNSLREVWE